MKKKFWLQFQPAPAVTKNKDMIVVAHSHAIVRSSSRVLIMWQSFSILQTHKRISKTMRRMPKLGVNYAHDRWWRETSCYSNHAAGKYGETESNDEFRAMQVPKKQKHYSGVESESR